LFGSAAVRASGPRSSCRTGPAIVEAGQLHVGRPPSAVSRGQPAASSPLPRSCPRHVDLAQRVVVRSSGSISIIFLTMGSACEGR
jgi:hypothetical protein